MHNEIRMDDEISLSEIWAVIRRYKYWVLGFPVAAMAAATVWVYFVLKPEWQASATIQIGQVGQVGQIGLYTGVPIEPANKVVERLSQSAFLQSALSGPGSGASNGKTPPGLVRHSFKASAVPGSPDLVNVRVRAYSKQDAERFLGAIGSHLQRVHAGLSSPFIQRLNLRLASINAEMAKLQVQRNSLLDQFKKAGNPAGSTPDVNSLILANTLTQQDALLFSLRQAKLETEAQLSPEATFPTSFSGPIQSGSKPVFPKKSLTILLSAILGLMGGLFMAFALNLRQQLKAGAR